MPDFNRNDTINFLSKLTGRRLWNGIKVLSSYYPSKWTKSAIQWGYPVSLSFEPTTSCNLRCPECPSGLRTFTRPTGMLKQDFFSETIDQLSKELLYLIFYFQGEPYLNPPFSIWSPMPPPKVFIRLPPPMPTTSTTGMPGEQWRADWTGLSFQSTAQPRTFMNNTGWAAGWTKCWKGPAISSGGKRN